jgi:CheY-like chemotaxis protein
LQPERLVVTVRDNGPGISAEMMPRLFTLFSQAQAGSGNNDGLGIGLALVRGLTELHGGSVRAESAGLGRGSEFTVVLPYPSGRVAAASPSVAPEGSSNAALRVLVVDDSQDAADTCATLLGLSGHTVRTAYTALGALELGERFHPQALLVDIGLQDLSGYELARRIRAAPWGRHATLIAVTGWGQEQDKRRALEAGFDHHLTKPVAADAVTTLLASLPGCAAS